MKGGVFMQLNIDLIRDILLKAELNPFEILLDTFESCNKMALLK